MIMQLQRKMFVILALPVAMTCLFMIQSFQKRPQWTAPLSADELKNPFANDTSATSTGKVLFTKNCAACHGPKGKGDGVAGIGLNPPPGNLASSKIQSQTDGAIYWKITEGNPPMASYKTTLSDEQRWQLVSYIRVLGTCSKKK